MKKRLIGVVTSDKMNKTRRVEVERLYTHPKYGKRMRSKIVCHVHDEENATHSGDTVEIVECRPMSRTKRWELFRVVEKALQLQAAAAEGAETAAPEAEA